LQTKLEAIGLELVTVGTIIAEAEQKVIQ